ncbi:L-lactate permease [Flexivirga meconopsidis]|uniref:L-lactate permease n=1 Tax=Flexivirga meconopsidis TaxID=2977121 RepID=UPI00223EC4AD|nr:L-lactate permease [Flexivirga meconopsidis]
MVSFGALAAKPFEQTYDPILSSLGWSSLVAGLPLLTVFALLGIWKTRAHWAALAGLVVAIVVAVAAYKMPIGQTLSATAEGAAFGLFPIMWIVVNAIWIYQMTVSTGHFDVLRRSFGAVSQDQRVQAVIIAFCFGALLEALAGFGTPVAITSVMLVALGFGKMKAAAVALVANTAPVAFGAIAVPITTLAKVTNLSEDTLAATIGRQTPILALVVPLALVYMVDGRRGVRQAWPAAVVGGFVFAILQFACSNYLFVALTDIVAALGGALAIVLLLRVWQPAQIVGAGDVALAGVPEARSGGGGGPAGAFAGQDGRADVAKAYAPYLIIIVVFSLAQVEPVKSWLAHGATTFDWPGLDIRNPAGKSPSATVFAFGWLPAAGTLLLIAGVLTALALSVRASQTVRAYGATLDQLKWAILTVAAVLALAYVMNLSGQTITIGMWIAGSGGVMALLSPILGWFGVAVTGSDTSSNALFGTLQVSAAKGTGISPELLASANSSGGVLGKMVSPQNLAIAAAAVGLEGKEGELLRRVLPWALGFLVVMCALVYLQSTSVLGWMLP